MTANGIDVGLLSSTPGGGENLGLAYLSASLRAAGHRPHVFTFDTWRDIEKAAMALHKLAPPLVGVSLPSGQMAIDALAADKPTPAKQGIGGLSNRFVITTSGGGGSKYMEW